MVNVVVCMLFGGVLGLFIVDMLVMGGVVILLMKCEGYSVVYVVNVIMYVLLVGVFMLIFINMIIYVFVV